MSIYYDKKWLMMGNFLTNYSPNFSTPKRKPKDIKFIILHYTGMKSENKAIKRLTDFKSKVSCHYFIKKNGKIILMVPESYVAWHSGKSSWRKNRSINKHSIGIEIHNEGHDYNYPNFKKEQINSTLKLCYFLKKKYKIKINNILAHSDVSYDRKKDPGEKFPWKLLSKQKFITWHNLRDSVLKKNRDIKISNAEKNFFFNNLEKIGYLKKQDNKNKKLLTIAFQRKYRCSLINGKVDRECLIISKKLSIA